MSLSFARWQGCTVALMAVGYAGYYLCRSDLSVAMPLLIREMAARGISPDAAKIQMGGIASLGVLGYAIGKFPSGWLADFLGGRRNFLFGMAGSIVFTLLFAIAGSIPLFTLAWMGNRCIQSLGWTGMVKIASRWFSYSAYGTAMGVVSLSYLFGDAASREFMARLIDAGFGWRGVFVAAAVTLAVLLLVNGLVLRETPQDRGFAEPPANPANLFRWEAETGRPSSFSSLLATFARSPIFWLVCGLSLGVTILRETFNLWTPTYFTQAVGLTVADAAHKSALFPLFGGLSVLLAGFLSDRLGKNGRASIIFYGLLLTAGTLVALALGDFGASRLMPVALVTLVAFLMIGPYSYLAGAISMDFGGKQGSATASGLIDGVGLSGRRTGGQQRGRNLGGVGLEGRVRRAGGGGDDVELRRRNLSLTIEKTVMNGTESRSAEVARLMQRRGGEAYFGEPVSQLEHALQAAWFATQANSAPSLVAAALLHDIRHLLHDLGEDVADQGIDTRHEDAGYDWLIERFGPAVADPVRSHVAAKRYLCAVDGEYLARLSPASVQSLALQGGPFTAEEVREFEQLPYYRDAVRLRRWDDAAKRPGFAVPALETYSALLDALPAGIY